MKTETLSELEALIYFDLTGIRYDPKIHVESYSVTLAKKIAETAYDYFNDLHDRPGGDE